MSCRLPRAVLLSAVLLSGPRICTAICSLLILFNLLGGTVEGADHEADTVVAGWIERAQPLLKTHCAECHGAAKQSAGLDLRALEDVLRGGDFGAAIDKEAPEASRLLTVLAADAEPHMPPDSQLADDERATLAEWVRNAVSHEADDLREALLRHQRSADGRDQPAFSYPRGIQPRLVIDAEIQAGWSRDGEPVGVFRRCDDATFLRRVFLDLLGRLPTAVERDAFMSATASDKRESLVDDLLASDEHANHFAEVFDTVLMGRKPLGRLRRRYRQGWIDYLRESFAENRPWNEVVREILLARPEDPADAGAIWYLYERENQHQAIAESISRGVFGFQIQCAQCHDHPLAEEIKQAHYWGLVAFFNRGTNQEVQGKPRVVESAIGGFSNFTNLSGESQPNRLLFLGAEVVEEPRPAEGEEQQDDETRYRKVDGEAEGGEAVRVPKFSRREKFVDGVLDGHPLVPRAMVNRLWAWTMGRGLVHPVDALDSTHPPSHPRLLEWLSEDFASHDFDVRRMLKELVLSQTYQQRSEAEQFVDPALFAHAAVKPLTAEMLYRSVLVALEIPLPETSVLLERMDAMRGAFPDVMAETSLANLRQSLLLSNGPDLQNLLTDEQSPLLARLGSAETSEQAVREAFESVLGRAPDMEEQRRAVAYLAARGDRLAQGLQQLVWALLTTAEFRFKH